MPCAAGLLATLRQLGRHLNLVLATESHHEGWFRVEVLAASTFNPGQSRYPLSLMFLLQGSEVRKRVAPIRGGAQLESVPVTQTEPLVKHVLLPDGILLASWCVKGKVTCMRVSTALMKSSTTRAFLTADMGKRALQQMGSSSRFCCRRLHSLLLKQISNTGKDINPVESFVEALDPK